MSLRDAAHRRAAARAERRSQVRQRAQAVREGMDAAASALAPTAGKQAPGTFRHLYSSRDDALSVFEDAAGHVVAVNAARLA